MHRSGHVRSTTRSWGGRKGVKSFGAPLYFIFHHEPEASGNLSYGTATEFIAAWRKIVTVFRTAGGHKRPLPLDDDRQ